MLKKLIQQLNRSYKNQPESVKRIRRSVILRAALGGVAVIVSAVLIFAASTAWFTNVAKTDTLTFEAEAWGYDGDLISFADGAITIAPGKNGIVPLSIDNSAKSEAVNITVSVDKSKIEKMGKDMQKRIYFYADTPSQENEEQMMRTYITSDRGYSYSILAGEKLTLSENYYNDIPLKWEWVYDMQGYYFRGTVSDGKVIEEEYVRPIQYDMETAVFEDEKESADGAGVLPRHLEKINGVSVEEFLADLSSHDGYKGTIDTSVDGSTEKIGEDTYYKVSVDEKGYGIWAYLCNYDELLSASEMDSQLAKGDAQYTATIKVTAKNVPTVTTAVQTASEFREAVNNTDVDVIKFESDIVSGLLTFESIGSKTVDLNGHTLSYSGDETTQTAFIMLTSGSKLTIMNGSIEKESSVAKPTSAILPVMSELTVSNVTSTGFDTAVFVADHIMDSVSPGGTDSIVKIQNCTFETKQSSVMVTGTGPKTDAKTKVIIQNSNISSKNYIGISGNGTTDQWGTDITVLDSKVSGKWSALYHPQKNSDMLISNSEFSGYTGMCVKGGTVTVCDSTIKGTGAHAPAAVSNGGFTDTGDAICVEAGYDWSASVVLKGKNTVTSDHSYALDLFGAAGKGPGKICVYDGADSVYTGGDTVEGKPICQNDIGMFDIYNKALRERLLPETANTEAAQP